MEELAPVPVGIGVTTAIKKSAHENRGETSAQTKKRLGQNA